MLLHVDAVLTSVDSVDMNWKNSHVFVRAVLTVLLVLTVLTLQTKRDRFWDKWSCIDKSLMTVLLHVATCWCCVDWCWQMLIEIGLWKVLIILERTFRRKWRLSIQQEPSAEYDQNFLSYRAIAEKWWNPYKSPESSQNTKNGSDINF